MAERISVKKKDEVIIDEVEVKEKQFEQPKEDIVIEKEPEEVTNSGMYICKTACWVASKKCMFNPRDITSFVDGEHIPPYFDKIK